MTDKSPIEQLRELTKAFGKVSISRESNFKIGYFENVLKIALTIADQLEKALAGNVALKVALERIIESGPATMRGEYNHVQIAKDALKSSEQSENGGVTG